MDPVDPRNPSRIPSAAPESGAAPEDAAAARGGSAPTVPSHAAAPASARRQPPQQAAEEEDDIYPMPFAACIGNDHGTAQPGRALPALVEVRLPLPLVQRLAAAGASLWASLAWGTGSGGALLRTPAVQLASASELSAASALFAAAAAAAAEAAGQQQAPLLPTGLLLPGGQRLSLPLELPPLLQLLRADPPLLLLQVFRQSAVDPSPQQLESSQAADTSDSSHQAASTSQAAAAQQQSPLPHPGSSGSSPSTDELLAPLPLLLLPSAVACAELMGLMPLPPEAAGGPLVGQAFTQHVAPVLLTLADALSGPQQQQQQPTAPAAAAAGGSSSHQSHQLAAYAWEVERLLVLLLSRDMTHTARHLVAAAERAGVAFANRHLLIAEEGEQQPDTPEEMESPLLPLATLPRLAIGSAAEAPGGAGRGGGGAAASAGEGGGEEQDALSGFETPPASRPSGEPPRLARLQQQWGSGDSPAGHSGSWDSSTPQAPPRAPEPVPPSIAALLEAFASQAASAAVAARVGSPPPQQPDDESTGSPSAQHPVQPAMHPVGGSAAATAAAASTSIEATAAPTATQHGAPAAGASISGAPPPAVPSAGPRALLSASLSSFPSPSDEADYHIYKATALRPAAGLLLLIESVVMPLALLLAHGPSAFPSPFGPARLSLLAFALAIATGPILGALAAVAGTPAAPALLQRIAAWLAAWRSGLVALCQAAEAGVVLLTAWGPEEGLRKLMVALGSYPVAFLLYGQLLKPALLQLNPKPAAACTLMRMLEHAAALGMAAASGPSDDKPPHGKAPAAPGVVSHASRWSVALLMVVTSAGGLVATVGGDLLLRARWARGRATQSSQQVGSGGGGGGGASHAKAD